MIMTGELLAESSGYLGMGLVLILFGGDSLLRGLAGLAQRFGLSPFTAGVLLIAFPTSIPELVVNAYAWRTGQIDLAFGNAIGSNIVNLTLTLAITALVTPLVIGMRVLAAELVLILVATGAVLFFSLDGTIARWEGGLLLAGYFGFLAFFFRRGREESAAVRAELTEFAETSTGMVQNLIRVAFAAVLLFFGAKFLVQGALGVGQALGFGSMLTGLVIVAIATAIPEIILLIMVARAGQSDIVAGHAFGACLFNLLFMVGAMALLRPLAVPVSFVSLALPATMALALVLLVLLRGDLRLGRRHGGVLLGLFVLWSGLACYPVWR
jgi:cation:H+ antiporter